MVKDTEKTNKRIAILQAESNRAHRGSLAWVEGRIIKFPPLAPPIEGGEEPGKPTLNPEAPVIGSYIADFYCPRSKLVIEVDGGQHYSMEGKEKDRVREDDMAAAGITVMRISDREVWENLDAVLEAIERSL